MSNSLDLATDFDDDDGDGDGDNDGGAQSGTGDDSQFDPNPSDFKPIGDVGDLGALPGPTWAALQAAAGALNAIPNWNGPQIGAMYARPEKDGGLTLFVMGLAARASKADTSIEVTGSADARWSGGGKGSSGGAADEENGDEGHDESALSGGFEGNLELAATAGDIAVVVIGPRGDYKVAMLGVQLDRLQVSAEVGARSEKPGAVIGAKASFDAAAGRVNVFLKTVSSPIVGQSVVWSLEVEAELGDAEGEGGFGANPGKKGWQRFFKKRFLASLFHLGGQTHVGLEHASDSKIEALIARIKAAREAARASNASKAKEPGQKRKLKPAVPPYQEFHKKFWRPSDKKPYLSFLSRFFFQWPPRTPGVKEVPPDPQGPGSTVSHRSPPPPCPPAGASNNPGGVSFETKITARSLREVDDLELPDLQKVRNRLLEQERQERKCP